MLVGWVSFDRLSVREYPRIDEPVVTVSTRLIGASSEVIESQVTKPLEDSIAGIDGAGHHHLDLALRAKPDHGALQAREEPRRRRRRRARQGLARARQAARRGRRAGHRQGRGRCHPDHLAGLHQRDAQPAGGHRPGQPHRQAAAADGAGRGRRADLRRPPVRDAHLARPGQAGRLPRHGAGCRGRAAPAEPRGAGRAHREPAARVQRHGAHRPEHRGAVRRGGAEVGQRLHGAAARRGAHRAGGRQRAHQRAPERGAGDLQRRHPQRHRQPAGDVRRCAPSCRRSRKACRRR